ncbi:cytochrome P450 [Catellatospora methionotrophica]|uniref:Cytochrome P450 n=1 Tax=Catellatospora methionotrophica TaxID=121620 RepID=A0A8J3L560_9ACTN|nr:cytochrome P450 [Catellatospora methionotrophica]GIG12322.1 cytochrome P450 [Catellatospora methionotrophica]
MQADHPDAGDLTARATIELDHHGADYRDRWQEISDGNVARCPVAHTAAYGGTWVVSGYEPVVEALRDHGVFSSYQDHTDPDAPMRGTSNPPIPALNVPQELDPPLHTVYRRLLNGPLSPEQSRRQEPFIRQVTAACLDRFTEQGRADLVADLTNPVPAIVTLGILGMPLADWAKYAGPIHLLTYSPPGSPTWDEAMAAVGEMMAALGALVVARRAEPTGDLVSVLATARGDDGELLPLDHVIATAGLVVAGGVDTTTALVSHALHWLYRNPAERDRLIADPNLLPTAVDEFLRVLAPVQFMSRTATRDVELGGQRIAAGERVMLAFAAANRDPAAFDCPSEMRLDRSPNRHVAFGSGVHRCVGAHLAKVEAVVMLDEILRRIPDYVIDEDAALRYPSIGAINGYIGMPATFTPTPAVGAAFPASGAA